MSDDFEGAPLEEEEEEVKPKPKSTPKKKVTPKDAEEVIAARSSKQAEVALRNLWPGRLIVKEDQVPSGNVYEFPAAGAVILVAAEDVEILLARHRRAGCCGAGQTEQRFFELA